MRTTTPDLDWLVDALAGAFIPLTEPEHRLVVTAYRLLGEGVPVDVAVLARVSGWRPDEVDARLGSWPGVYLDSDGRLVGLWGMAVEAVSPHAARIADQGGVWMWCALDPLFIVPLLGAEAAVSSTCPTSGDLVCLTVSATGLATVEPASTVVSLLMPDGPFDDAVRQTFCHFVHFFVSPAAAEGWTAQHPGTFWLPVTDAAEVGRRLAARAFPTVKRH